MTVESWKKFLQIAQNLIFFHENGNIIHFRDTLAVTGIITNTARVTKKSADSQAAQLIKKLNRSYYSIKHITEEEIV